MTPPFRRPTPFRATCALILATVIFMPRPASAKKPPVPTKRQDVVDVVHGTKVFDPYRWLENADDPAVAEWTEKQNATMRSHLDKVPARGAIEKRLWALFQSGDVGTPVVKGGNKMGKSAASDRLFYTRRDGKENQPVLYTRLAKAAPHAEKVLFNPNQNNTTAPLALDWWHPSPDGRLVAIGTSENGSEESTLRLLATDGIAPNDTIPHTRAASLTFLPDNTGFYYTRYPAPGTVPQGEDKYHRAVFFHPIGGDPNHDTQIFPAPGDTSRDMTEWPSVALSDDGRFVVITASQGWSQSELWILDRKAKAPKLRRMVGDRKANFDVVDINDSQVFVISNEDAPRGKIFVAELRKPERKNWKTVIAQSDDTLQSATLAGDKIGALYLHDAASRIRLYSLAGKPAGHIDLPSLGTTGTLSGRAGDNRLYFDFQSFFIPKTVYALDLKTNKRTVWAQPEVPINGDDFEVHQVKVASTHCAQIPMFIVHKRGIKPDGNNPTLLYGYGGFNISLTPTFSAAVAPFLEAGGVYAVANLRGGGEYGEAWHEAGMLKNKQNVFDDFIAAAEHLIASQWTNKNKLAASGRSNGGLLVGAAITQRPDLFAAAISGVPLLDMIRYHKFRIAKLWIPEYGDPDKAEDFKWLYAYSPYHNIKAGTAYPATLIFTAASDTRVDAMHARKMVARLQRATSSERPILLRLEGQAGHGAGKPLGKRIAQYTDEMSFLFQYLGVPAR